MSQKWYDIFNVPQPRIVAYHHSLITLSTLITVEELQTAVCLHGKPQKEKPGETLNVCGYKERATQATSTFCLMGRFLSSPKSLSA